MPSLSLANALKDFGGSPPGPTEPFAPPAGFALPAAELPDFPAVPAAEPIDVDAIVSEAVAEAVAAAEARLREQLAAEHDEALRLERERHAGEADALRRQAADAATETIRLRLAETEARLIELTCAVAARILGTVLTDDLRQRSLERLAGLIRDALRDTEAVRIRVRGSLPLFEALKDKLPDHGEQLDFAESPDLDLAVSIDDSVYETRLAEWSLALSETLA